jgi:hypothetical protein
MKQLMNCQQSLGQSPYPKPLLAASQALSDFQSNETDQKTKKSKQSDKQLRRRSRMERQLFIKLLKQLRRRSRMKRQLFIKLQKGSATVVAAPSTSRLNVQLGLASPRVRSVVGPIVNKKALKVDDISFVAEPA